MGEQAREVREFGELHGLLDRMRIAFNSLDVSWELRILPEVPCRLEIRIVSPSYHRKVSPSGGRLTTQSVTESEIWRATQANATDVLWDKVVRTLKGAIGGNSN